MKGRILQNTFLLLAIALVVSFCAKQASPTGGPKDETPPEIVKSIPVSGVTNFKGKEIEITFNEYLQLDKLTEKFMISPPLNEKPDIYLRGKSLFIRFREDMKDSTTYTLYFADAVKDLNEGNPISNFQFVFATGSVIDSLSVTGNVLFADNLEAGKNVLVTIYRQLADSAPRKMLPDYITLADINGGFRINNIKEGKYRMFALIDNNSNKKYDLADEVFAFLDTIADINHYKNWLPVPKDTAQAKPVIKPVVKPVTGPLKPGEKPSRVKEIPMIDGEYKLFLFTAPKKARYLTSTSRKQPYQLVYTLSLPPDTLDFSFDIEGIVNRNWIVEKSKALDTMTIWLQDSVLYSELLLNSLVTYPFTDSTGKIISRTDTIPMRSPAVRSARTRPVRNPMKFSSNLSPVGLGPGQKIIFQSMAPMVAPDTSRIRVYETDAKTKKAIPWYFERDSANSRILRLEAVFTPEKKYNVIIDKGAFRNIYGEYSDSTGLSFVVRTPDSYGNLLLKISNVPCSIIVQLLSDKEKLIAEKRIKNAGNVQFPLLERGFYRLRAVYDLNGDGEWNTGDFDRGVQPEPVSYLPKEVEIKVNWNHEEEWDTGIINIKDPRLKTKKE
jgi:uncharacterized protein (DUF2141 family)